MQGNLIATATLWDWFILIVGLLSTLSGCWRGFVRLAFGMAGWVMALLFTVPVTAMVLVLLRELSVAAESTPPTIVIQVLIFIVLLLLVWWAGALVRRLLLALRLGGLDRFLGGVLGLLRALLIVAIAAMIALRLGFANEPAWRNAISAPLLDQLALGGFRLLDEYGVRPDLSALKLP